MTVNEERWIPVASTSSLASSRKLVVNHDDRLVLVLWNDGAPVALVDKCIHRGRSLSQGVLLNGRIVCPGHQWAFDIQTGLCRERDRCQPGYGVRVQGDEVLLTSRTRSTEKPRRVG